MKNEKSFFKNSRILNMTLDKNLIIVSICLTINCIILTCCIVYLNKITEKQNNSIQRIQQLCRDIKA